MILDPILKLSLKFLKLVVNQSELFFCYPMALSVMLLNLKTSTLLDLFEFFEFIIFEYASELLGMLQILMNSVTKLLRFMDLILKRVIFVKNLLGQLITFFIHIFIVQLTHRYSYAPLWNKFCFKSH